MEDSIILSEEKCLTYVGGGINITAAFLSSISTFIKTCYGIGQSLGSNLRRLITGQSC